MQIDSPVERAALAERAVRTRNIRRLWAFPGTRLGVVSHPARPPHRLFLAWRYWWQAHLFDCIVDAQLRDPRRERTVLAQKMVRASLIRNGFRRTNSYYDDMAWWGLALQRGNDVFGTSVSVASIIRACRGAIRAEGVVPWRVGDDFLNAPANGPVAIMLARAGYRDEAARITDWIAKNLMLGSGLVADGLVISQEGARLDATVYTYCQGVVLGAELEVMGAESPRRIMDLVSATWRHLSDPDGVITGQGGGDGGLFAGILARYLTLVANRFEGSDDTRQLAAQMVRASADAAWHNAAKDADGLPCFGPEWNQPARTPERSHWITERDLSVQLSGWMLMEAAAALPA